MSAIGAGTRLQMEHWPFEGDNGPVLHEFDLQNAQGQWIGSGLGCWEQLPEGIFLTVLDPKNPEDAEPGNWEQS